MTDKPHAMPELPEPELGYIETDKSRQPAFSARQMREALPAPQQATPEPVGEPFGYFRALPFGWEQCGEHDDGAVALYTRPAPGVPDTVPVYVYQHSSTGQIRAHYIEAANEFERSESRWEWLHVASIEPRLFIQEHYATVSDGQHAAERHQFIKPLPEPFGYVSDWFGVPGVRFQREPYPELHQLTHSVASVYSVSQLMRSAHDAHTAGREQGLSDAAARVRQQAERIAELEARVHTCGPTCSKAGCINRRLTEERDQLRAEVERLRADAERWEWIADGSNFDDSFALLTDPKLTTYELTRAVDAARTRKETK